MPKFLKKSFLAMEPAELGKLKLSEARSLLRQARAAYEKQEKTFSKYKDSVWSPSVEKMQDYYEDTGKNSISKMRLSKVQNELFRLQDFFGSETSTVPGARRVMLEQDRRIFGTNEKTGKPIKRMSLDQRTDFWAAYNEFVNMEKESYIRNMGSNTIQTFLGQIILEKNKKGDGYSGFDSSDFKELRRRIARDREREEWEMSSYESGDSDVLSGKRSY